MNLTQLGLKYGTDKATHHGYTEHYHERFKDIRMDVKNVLEIGTAKGASIQMWRDYFPNAMIYTVDIRNIYEYPAHDRIVLCRYNFGKREDSESSFTHHEYKYPAKDGFKGINTFLKELPIEFDIIIDDGSHMMKDQQLTLAILFEQVKSGGIYVLEDLTTSHDRRIYDRYKVKGDTNSLAMLKRYNETGKFESVHMSKEEMDYLNENITYCEILEMPISSKATLAFMGKKAAEIVIEEPEPELESGKVELKPKRKLEEEWTLEIDDEMEIYHDSEVEIALAEAELNGKLKKKI